jgi:sugar lactone lactonase YvrE
MIGLGQAAATAHSEVVATLEGSSEGVAVDKSGNIYVTLNWLGKIEKIGKDGSVSTFYDFQLPYPLHPLAFGALGLAVDAPGNVYVALNTRLVANHGVWRISQRGDAERLPGTEQITLPNALVFDEIGNLYVSDTLGGKIWRVPRDGGDAQVWVENDLLLGVPITGLPIPLGANGIVYMHGEILVANLTKLSIVRVPVLQDRSAGEPELYATGAFVPDGIALDVHGNVYICDPAFNRILRLDRSDGTLTVVADGADGLAGPASIAFGTGAGNKQSVYVTSFNWLTGVPADIVKVDVGVPGLPLP